MRRQSVAQSRRGKMNRRAFLNFLAASPLVQRPLRRQTLSASAISKRLRAGSSLRRISDT